jgi:hypothetical protein
MAKGFRFKVTLTHYATTRYATQAEALEHVERLGYAA